MTDWLTVDVDDWAESKRKSRRVESVKASFFVLVGAEKSFLI
jgi:hypothetical protein